MLSSLPPWYVVHVKRNSERRVVAHLTLRSIPNFLPFIESIQSRRGRGGAALDPLFPGYLFVRMPPVEESPGTWDAVQWTPGVRRILGTDGTPIPMPGGVVEAIQEKVLPYGFIRPGTPFQPGSRVRFHRGPLVGLEALFERPMPRFGRVCVLMTLLGQQTAVEVDCADLECA